MKDKLRNALEQRMLRQAEELLAEMTDERRDAAAGLLAEVAGRGEQVAAAEARLRALHRRLDELGVETDDRLEQVEHLVREVARRDELLRQQTEQVAALKARADAAESEARERAAAAERLDADLHASSDYPVRIAELRELEQRLEAQQEHVTSLQTFVLRERKRIGDAKEELEHAWARLREREEALAARAEEIEADGRRAALLDDRLTEREERLQEREERLARRALELGAYAANVQASLGQ